MNHQAHILFLLCFLAGIILISGCTGLNPTAVAKSNAMIKQFLNEHPNAKIVATHFTAEQSRDLIEQIRKDCDNPYINQKEFYRVTITDPDTNFYAVVWIDWKAQTVDCAYKLGAEGKTIDKPKPKPGCENHATYKCDSGHLYWYDSCGNRQEKKEYCQNGCSNGECSSQPNQTQICTQGQTKSCGSSNIGICKYGTQTCINGNWGPCTGSINATTEVCGNQLDDDCDGQIDENCQGTGDCTDTDGGKDYYVKGTASGNEVQRKNGIVGLNDSCIKIYPTGGGGYVNSCEGQLCELEEYYCGNDGLLTSVSYVCPYGCSNGACIQQTDQTCIDSDGGINFDEKGNTSGLSSEGTPITETDNCGFSSLDSNGNPVYTYINEFYCGKDSVVYGYQYICPNGCKDGACIAEPQPSSCTDTDDGQDYYKKGILDNYIPDFCSDSSMLGEYFCDNKVGKLTYYVCPNGCKDGACVQNNQTQTCTDSDGGNYYIKGTTTAGSESKTDECTPCPSASCGAVIERYCDGNTVQSYTYICPNGCSDGACLQPNQTCIDSDGGINYNTKGTATKGSSNVSDSCEVAALSPSGSSYVKTYSCPSTEAGCRLSESFCSNNEISIVNYTCTYGCSQGACLEQSNRTCQDSDNGKNYFVKGTTALSTGEELSDSCYGNLLQEYYCETYPPTWPSIAVNSYQCPNGCSDGKCN